MFRRFSPLAVLMLVLLASPGGGQERQPEPESPVLLVLDGEKVLGEAELLREIDYLLESLGDRVPDAFDLEDIDIELSRHYQRRGFPDIEIEVRKNPDNPRQIRARIQEGRRTYLRTLELSVDPVPAADRVHLPAGPDQRACFRWENSGFLDLGQAIFSPDVFQEGLENLRTLYRLSGFLDVSFETSSRREPGTDLIVPGVRVTPGSVVLNRPGGTHGLHNDGDAPLRLFVVEVAVS